MSRRGDVQLDSTPEIEVFEKCHAKNRNKYITQHIKYFNFRSKVQLDNPCTYGTYSFRLTCGLSRLQNFGNRSGESCVGKMIVSTYTGQIGAIHTHKLIIHQTCQLPLGAFQASFRLGREANEICILYFVLCMYFEL